MPECGACRKEGRDNRRAGWSGYMGIAKSRRRCGREARREDLRVLELESYDGASRPAKSSVNGWMTKRCGMPRSREPTQLPFPQWATLDDDHAIKSRCPNFFYTVI